MNAIENKVLVTGADGFIGSHLVEMLLREGLSVKALSLYNSFGSRGWLEDIDKNDNLEIIAGDIRDLSFCQKITKGIDTIYHLAALIAIPYSYVSPQSYLETNIHGTMNMCQAALDNKNKRFINTSTSEVYGTAKYIPIDEGHPLQAQSPYSASKISADAIAMSFYNSFDLPLTIARPFNTYGPRQSARAVIPNIISQIASGRESIKLGDLSPTRDFTYVEDTVRGIHMVSQNDEAVGEVINIGSGFEISILELVNLISGIMDREIKITQEEKRIRPEKSEVNQLFCDPTKLKEYTSFETQFSLEKGLKKTIEWFTSENNLSKYKPDEYNI